MEIPLAVKPETPEQRRQRILDEKKRLFKATQYIGEKAMQSFEGGPTYEAIKKGDEYVDDTLSSIINRLSVLLGNSNAQLDDLLEILGFTREMLKDPVAGFYGGHFYGINTEYTPSDAIDDEQGITEHGVTFIELDTLSLPVSFAEYQKQRIAFFADNALAYIHPGANLLADGLSEFNSRINSDELDGVEINEANLQARLVVLRTRKNKLESDLNKVTADWLIAKKHHSEHCDNYDNFRNYDYEIKDEKMQNIEDFLQENCRTLNRRRADILDEIGIIDAQICSTEYGISCAQDGAFLTLQDLAQYQIPKILGDGIDRYPMALDLVWSLALDALTEHLEQDDGPYSDVGLDDINPREIFIGSNELRFLQEYISGEARVEVAKKIAEITFDKISAGLFYTPVYQPPDKLRQGVSSSDTKSTLTIKPLKKS